MLLWTRWLYRRIVGRLRACSGLALDAVPISGDHLLPRKARRSLPIEEDEPRSGGLLTWAADQILALVIARSTSAVEMGSGQCGRREKSRPKVPYRPQRLPCLSQTRPGSVAGQAPALLAYSDRSSRCWSFARRARRRLVRLRAGSHRQPNGYYRHGTPAESRRALAVFALEINDRKIGCPRPQRRAICRPLKLPDRLHRLPRCPVCSAILVRYASPRLP